MLYWEHSLFLLRILQHANMSSSSLSAERVISIIDGSVRTVTTSLALSWDLCLVQHFTCFELKTLHEALVLRLFPLKRLAKRPQFLIYNPYFSVHAGFSGRGLRRRSVAARLLRSWVRIPPGAWMFVCCECSVLSGRGLRDELITRPEESYRLWCVVVCDIETSRMRRPWPALGRNATEKKNLFNALWLDAPLIHPLHISLFLMKIPFLFTPF